MEDFHRRLVASVYVTATRALDIFTVNRDKKREILLAVISKDRKYRAEIMAALIVTDILSKENTTQQVSFADEKVDIMQDVDMPQTFLSKNRHYSTTSEELSERWGLSISQDAINLKAMTQKLTRSAIMPLARRYRADRMFNVCRIHGTMSNDTMDARFQSIHNKDYCQVFGNKQFFVEAYPINKKSDFHIGLYKFFKEYGAPDKMTYNGSQEKNGRQTEFQRVMRKYEIK